MRNTKENGQRIILWSNGRDVALVLEWLDRQLYDGWNSSPRVVLYEATLNPAVCHPRKSEVTNRFEIERAQKAVRLGLPAAIPEPVLEDTSAYGRYETAEAYKVALAEHLEKYLKYSEYHMEFQVNFKGQRGDEEEGVEEVPSFPLLALLADGQVSSVTRGYIKVEATEWPTANPTFDARWCSHPSPEFRKEFLERITRAEVSPEVAAMCEFFAQGVDAYRKGTTDKMESERRERDRRELARQLGIPLPEESAEEK